MINIGLGPDRLRQSVEVRHPEPAGEGKKIHGRKIAESAQFRKKITKSQHFLIDTFKNRKYDSNVHYSFCPFVLGEIMHPKHQPRTPRGNMAEQQQSQQESSPRGNPALDKTAPKLWCDGNTVIPEPIGLPAAAGADLSRTGVVFGRRLRKALAEKQRPTSWSQPVAESVCTDPLIVDWGERCERGVSLLALSGQNSARTSDAAGQSRSARRLPSGIRSGGPVVARLAVAGGARSAAGVSSTREQAKTAAGFLRIAASQAGIADRPRTQAGRCRDAAECAEGDRGDLQENRIPV
jgi:hypothetical protein